VSDTFHEGSPGKCFVLRPIRKRRKNRTENGSNLFQSLWQNGGEWVGEGGGGKR